jgi:integrase
VIAALQTGARYGELCRLRVGDFDPDSGTLLVRLSKSGKSRRIVLTTEGAQFFGQLCAGRDSGDLMLRRADGAAWGRGHQQRPMAEACKRAKITPPATIHTTRHTWASLSIMSGMPLQVAAQNLGHADTTMVEKHYGHLSKSFVADAVRAHGPQFGLTKSNVAVLR